MKQMHDKTEPEQFRLVCDHLIDVFDTMIPEKYTDRRTKKNCYRDKRNEGSADNADAAITYFRQRTVHYEKNDNVEVMWLIRLEFVQSSRIQMKISVRKTTPSLSAHSYNEYVQKDVIMDVSCL